MFNGKGTITYADGTKKVGYFENGKFDEQVLTLSVLQFVRDLLKQYAPSLEMKLVVASLDVKKLLTKYFSKLFN